MNEMTPQPAIGADEAMTWAEAVYKASPEFKEHRYRIITEALALRVEQLMRIDAPAVIDALAFCLDDLSEGGPTPIWVKEQAADDAQWWAECANPFELEAYTAAGLKQIGNTTWATPARKRLIALLWRGLSPGDKAGFLRHVGEGDA